MSFELSTQIVGNLPAIIINDEELKEELSKFVEPYKTIVFEDTKEAKKDLAMLRKLDKEIDDRKKAIKKEYMKHYDEFEMRIKDLRSIVAEPISIISGKVNEFEEDRKNQKLDAIRKIFDEEFKDIPVDLNKLLKESWLNATCTESAIRSDMQTIRLDFENGIRTIRLLGSDVTDKAIEIYLGTTDLTQAISYIKTYEDAKKAVVKEEEKKAEIAAKSPDEIMNNKIGFPGKGEVQINLHVICHKNKVYELMKLLYENGFDAEIGD